jgi:hypothetical protein
MTLLLRIVDSPLPWAIAGVAIGFVLGVTSLSMWLLVAGFGGYVIYLRMHGAAEEETEGNLVAAGPVFMMAWVLGIILKDVV